MFLGSGAGPAHKDDKLTVIFEPIAYTTGEPDECQPYRPPRPIAGITLLFTFNVVLESNEHTMKLISFLCRKFFIYYVASQKRQIY
jgi:hypothetical protein